MKDKKEKKTAQQQAEEVVVPEDETVKPAEQAGEEAAQETVNEQHEKPDTDETEETCNAGESEAQEEVVDEAKAELLHCQQELEQTTDALKRSVAEFANYRKRTDKEKADSASYGQIHVVQTMLPVLDNLERAAEAPSADGEYKKGVELTLTMFKKTFADLGVSEIEALGNEFDPAVHNAVARQPSEEYESGKVMMVLQKGYRMHDRVVRPAMVSVAE